MQLLFKSRSKQAQPARGSLEYPFVDSRQLHLPTIAKVQPLNKALERYQPRPS